MGILQPGTRTPKAPSGTRTWRHGLDNFQPSHQPEQGPPSRSQGQQPRRVRHPSYRYRNMRTNGLRRKNWASIYEYHPGHSVTGEQARPVVPSSGSGEWSDTVATQWEHGSTPNPRSEHAGWARLVLGRLASSVSFAMKSTDPAYLKCGVRTFATPIVFHCSSGASFRCCPAVLWSKVREALELR